MFNDFIVNFQKSVIEQVAWAERKLKGKTGPEKKAAVVKKLDDIITIGIIILIILSFVRRLQ